jgi:hypothetical protein
LIYLAEKQRSHGERILSAEKGRLVFLYARIL